MISILGAGAIGQLLAHKLTEASIDCQLIVRPDTRLDSDQWQVTVQDTPTYHEIKTITASDCDELGQLWICVKSPQLKAALESVAHAITAETAVVLFQNGMGHENVANQFINPENVFLASNTHGAYQQGTQNIHYGGQGSITFGNLDHSKQPAWLTPSLLETLNATWSDDIQSVLWQKLFVNAVVNPLTAIHQCKNGALLGEPIYSKVITLINENKRLAEAMQLEIAAQLKDTTLSVIRNTAKNQSSMLQDVLRGQETEINAINGYLLESAQRYGIHAPHNWRLWSEFHIAYPPLKSVCERKAQDFDSLTYQVTQQHGTEPPFSGSYNLHHEQGVYRCICCNSPLFADDSKFDSGCGWPSFDKAQDNKAIAYREDTSHDMHRTEILCAQCGSHLGHVFNDGPTATGQRFCVNSVSLNFTKENS